MAKRFGRNQKRKMREEIDRLKKQVVWPCGVATGEEPDISDLGIIGYVQETTEKDSMRGDEKSVTVSFAHVPNLAPLHDLVIEQGVVQFEGARYMLDEINIDHDRDPFFRRSTYEEIHITMKGVL